MDPTDLFRAFLGILTTAQLLEAGVLRSELDRALRDGRVRRVRHGWIAWHPSPVALAAVSSGACVSCVSALDVHGAWRPRGNRLHVRMIDRRRDSRPAAGKGCRPYGRNPPVRAAVDDLETSFQCALRCADREQLVAIADSLLHRGLATIEELRRWAATAPLRVRASLDLLEPLAESGTESMVRLRLRALGIALRVQQRIAGYRVDLLIGDRLVIECDSTTYHADPEAFQRDRRRDRELTALGYLVVRLTWEQIHDDWPAVERDLLAIIRRRDHRWQSRHRREIAG